MNIKSGHFPRFISILAAFFTAFSIGFSASAYADLPESHWAYDEITRAASLNIMNGLDNGFMAPNKTLTWAQYLAMLCRAFASADYWDSQSDGVAWDMAGYQTALRYNFLRDPDFLPVTMENMRKTPITRQDAAVLLHRVLTSSASGSVAASTPVPVTPAPTFTPIPVSPTHTPAPTYIPVTVPPTRIPTHTPTPGHIAAPGLKAALERVQELNPRVYHAIKSKDSDFPDDIFSKPSGNYAVSGRLPGGQWTFRLSWNPSGGTWILIQPDSSKSGGNWINAKQSGAISGAILKTAFTVDKIQQNGELTGENPTPTPRVENALTDFYQIDANYQEAVKNLYALGIIRGKSDGTFGPKDTIRRGDGAVLLMRVLDYIDKSRDDDWTSVILSLSDEAGNLMGTPVNTVCRINQNLSALASYYAPENYKASDRNNGHISIASNRYTLYITPMAAFEIADRDAQEQLRLGEITQEEYETADFWLDAPGDNARKRILIYGDPNITHYQTEEEAAPNMISIEIPIWRLVNQQKIPDIISIKIHSALADDVKEIFTEIYNDPEQFPFESIGGYNWGGTIETNEHRNGSAIDLNPDANFCIRDGEIIVGSHWTPGEDPYSIPSHGSVTRIFQEHGWTWGGSAWAGHANQNYDYHDYMHFSYRGR